jgi:hypothetical protein
MDGALNLICLAFNLELPVASNVPSRFFNLALAVFAIRWERLASSYLSQD